MQVEGRRSDWRLSYYRICAGERTGQAYHAGGAIYIAHRHDVRYDKKTFMMMTFHDFSWMACHDLPLMAGHDGGYETVPVVIYRDCIHDQNVVPIDGQS